jgi:hypothetical protein
LLRAALLAAQPEPMPGSKSGASLLRLPPGVCWPQLGDAPLFVRHFYRDCYEGALGSLKEGKRFIIIGNSGSAYRVGVGGWVVGVGVRCRTAGLIYCARSLCSRTSVC